MGTSDLEEELSWLMEWNGWAASFHLSPLDWHSTAICGCGGSEASPCLILRKMQEMVKQYDPSTGVNPAKNRERMKAQIVAKYKVYDAIAMLNSITVYIKHGPWGWCECMRPALCCGLAHSSSGHFPGGWKRVNNVTVRIASSLNLAGKWGCSVGSCLKRERGA